MSDNQPSMLPSIVAGVVAAIISVGIWAGTYSLIDTKAYWLSPVLGGLVIGLVMRSVGKSNDRKLQPIAAVLTFFASWLGYATVYATMAKFVNTTYVPTFQDGLGDFFNYLDILCLTALGCYLAYVMASKTPRTAPH